MQTINYETGVWRVVVTLQDVDDSKRLAIILATMGEGDGAVESRHTVVFQHAPERDDIEEAKAFADRILM